MTYYTDIDELPIWNWCKIQETNDVTFLLRKRKKCSNKELVRLGKAFKTISDEYVNAFGLTDQHLKILELRKKIQLCKLSLAITGETINITNLEIHQQKLEAIAGKTEKSDPGSVKIHAEKWMGRAIDMKTTSVRDFYLILGEMKKDYAAKAKAAYKK